MIKTRLLAQPKVMDLRPQVGATGHCVMFFHARRSLLGKKNNDTENKEEEPDLEKQKTRMMRTEYCR